MRRPQARRGPSRRGALPDQRAASGPAHRADCSHLQALRKARFFRHFQGQGRLKGEDLGSSTQAQLLPSHNGRAAVGESRSSSWLWRDWRLAPPGRQRAPIDRANRGSVSSPYIYSVFARGGRDGRPGGRAKCLLRPPRPPPPRVTTGTATRSALSESTE